jgi:hypothetical protein
MRIRLWHLAVAYIGWRIDRMQEKWIRGLEAWDDSVGDANDIIGGWE